MSLQTRGMDRKPGRGKGGSARRAAWVFGLASALTLPLTAQPIPGAYTGAGVAQGLTPQQTFHLGDIDHVNLLNGNLVLTVPIGPKYPLSEGFSYQFVLSHNSNIWDFEQICDGNDDCKWDAVLRTEGNNAGLGWRLSLGEYDDTQPVPKYIDESGAEHAFYGTLHESDPADTAYYTRDGTYLRLTRTVAGTTVTAEVEFPDGRVKTFVGASGSRLPLTEIRDPFGNWVTISYSPLQWSLADSHGRSHTVVFEAVPPDPSDPPYFTELIDKVELAGFDGTINEWDFSYLSPRDLVKQCPFNNEESVSPIVENLSPLSTVTVPDADFIENLDFVYDWPSIWDPDDGCEDQSGQIIKVFLPHHGGVIEYEYQHYQFPNRVDDPLVFPFGIPDDLVTGVAKRTVFDHEAPPAVWTYVPVTGIGDPSQPPDPTQGETWADEIVNKVTHPDGHKSEHYFSVDKDLVRWTDGPSLLGYGLPFSRARSIEDDPDNPCPQMTPDCPVPMTDLYLSTEVFDDQETLLRSTYVSYELDDYPSPVPASPKPANPRPRREVTIYHDDILPGGEKRYAETTYSDFDGLGHYRATTTGGNFVSGNARTATTHYNPDRGTYEIVPATNLPAGAHTYSAFPATDPWVLGTFDRREVTDTDAVVVAGVNGTTQVETFCFDESTGFLERQRTWVGETEGANDLIVDRVPEAGGNVAFERFYGGDVQTVGSGGLCSLSLPSSPEYQIDHQSDSGVRKLSQYTDGGTPVPGKILDLDIDSNTGLPKTRRDIAEMPTHLEYDEIGRLTLEERDPGDGAWIQRLYFAKGQCCEFGAYARVEAWDGSPSSGTILHAIQIEYDGFGRPVEETNGIGGFRDHEYDGEGRPARRSEWVNSIETPTWTDFEYDFFGRPTRIQPPDGAAHAVTFDYDGVSRVRRTASIAQPGGELPMTVEEEYDRQGRLVRVTEPIHGSGGTTTEYGYDVGGRLALVRTTSPVDSSVQERFFTYDRRGLLVSEQHPEKGASGNGLVQYLDYDSRGHAGRTEDGPSRLSYTYDLAERLTEIRDTDSGQLLKGFTYGTADPAGVDHRLGKLVRATRFNDLPQALNDPPLSLPDTEIAETYEYEGVGGRLSRKVTERDGVAWFEQTFSWNQLGDLEILGYPECVHTDCSLAAEPERDLQHSYFPANLLNNVCDYDATAPVPCTYSWTGGIHYWPSGMLELLEHYGSLEDHWDRGADLMARPVRIHTTGVVGTPFDTDTIQYDGAGNVSAMGPDSFTYDGTSRLVSGTTGEGAYLQENQYDPFGNRVAVATDGLMRPIPTDPATNRLAGSPERPTSYDAAGNLTSWGVFSYAYDPFHQLVHQTGSATGTAVDKAFLYGPGDERISTVDTATGAARWTVRDHGNRVVRTFNEHPTSGWSWEKDYIYRDGKLFASTSAAQGELRYHLDHLGTVRMITRIPDRTVFRHHDYFGFGEEAPFPDYDSERLRFTSHERDEYGFDVDTCAVSDPIVTKTYTGTETETACVELSATDVDVLAGADVTFRAGESIVLEDFSVAAGAVFTASLDSELQTGVLTDLDYMHARYYSPWMGRFLSTDPINSGKPGAPQSWNKYTYGLNNPMKYVDPDGEFAVTFAVLVGAGIIGGLLAADAANAPESVDTPLVEPKGPGGMILGSGIGVATAGVGRTILTTAAGVGELAEQPVCAGPCDDPKRRRAVAPGQDRPDASGSPGSKDSLPTLQPAADDAKGQPPLGEEIFQPDKTSKKSKIVQIMDAILSFFGHDPSEK